LLNAPTRSAISKRKSRWERCTHRNCHGISDYENAEFERCPLAERKKQAAAEQQAAEKRAERATAKTKKTQGQASATAASSSSSSTKAVNASAPLWVRHDPGREAVAVEQPLAEWTFARRMKTYAEAAGLEKFHLHQTRHTFARIVAEATGSLSQTQEALGHQHLATTRAYVESISTILDRHRDAIAERMEAGPGKKTPSGKA
jgi:Phage integrase family